MSNGQVATWSGKVWRDELISSAKSSASMSWRALHSLLSASCLSAESHKGHKHLSMLGRKKSLLKVDWVFSVPSYRNCLFFLRCLFSGRLISISRFTAKSVWQEAGPFSLKSTRYSLTPSVSVLSVSMDTFGLCSSLLTKLTWYKTLYQVIVQSRKDQGPRVQRLAWISS